MPGNYRSIIDHVGHGKDWGLDRKKGGLFLLPGNPYGTTKRGMRLPSARHHLQQDAVPAL